MTPDDLMRDLALGLRDVLVETPDSCFKDDPEDVFHDLAHRLVLRLSGTLTIQPKSVVDRDASTPFPCAPWPEHIFVRGKRYDLVRDGEYIRAEDPDPTRTTQ